MTNIRIETQNKRGRETDKVKNVVKFKIDYLKTMKRTIVANKTADSFIVAMKKAYPNLPGEAGLTDLANALYK